MNNDKIEEMLTQLIKIVGNMQTDIQGLKADNQSIKAEIQEMKATNEKRHHEIMNQFKTLEDDQDFI